MKNKLTDEEVKEKIEKFLNIENVKEICNYNTNIRNEKIRELKYIKGTSCAQIARVIGISKAIVERAMKKLREEEGDVSQIVQKCSKGKRPQLHEK